MNILYLHGLNSTHINERTEYLQKLGHLIHPAMNYGNYPADFQYIESLFAGIKLDLIVGSSLGGYFAFHLGNYYNVPTLLLNPALLITNIVKPDNRQKASEALHTISIGVNDSVIPPQTTYAVLQQLQARYKIYKYHIGHETPFEVFLDICEKMGMVEK